MQKLNSIQYLRAIAAILVVYSHAIGLQASFSTSWQQGFFFLPRFGAIGVDIFFVISGFIIAHITTHLNGKTQAVQFLKKRFIRIYPSYYIATGLFVLAVLFFSNIHEIGSLSKGLVKTLTILPIFDRYSFKGPLLTIGWTLSFECLFYIAAAALIFFSVTKKNMMLVAVLVLLTLTGWLLPLNEVHYTFLTNPMVLEFCFGVLIAQAYRAFTPKRIIAYSFLIAGLCWYVWLVFKGYGDISQYINIVQGELCWQRVALWGMPSAFLVTGLLFIEKSYTKPTFTGKFWLLLGDASYAIYLVHLTVFECLHAVFNKTSFNWHWISPDILLWIFVSLGVTTGIIFYKVIEVNLLRVLNKFLLPARR